MTLMITHLDLCNVTICSETRAFLKKTWTVYWGNHLLVFIWNWRWFVQDLCGFVVLFPVAQLEISMPNHGFDSRENIIQFMKCIPWNYFGITMAALICSENTAKTVILWNIITIQIVFCVNICDPGPQNHYNTLYGSKLFIFLLCQKSLGY